MTESDKNLLYKTQLVNEDGVNGVSFVNEGDRPSIAVSHPLNEIAGTNPEQLFGLAQATCLNATIKALLKDEKSHPSRVSVTVAYKREADGSGTFFDVDIKASIKDLPLEEVANIAHRAEGFCPISKLVAASSSVSLSAVEYEEAVPKFK